MTDRLTLTSAELRELTGSVRRSTQRAELDAMGVEDRLRRDGSIVVLRAALEDVGAMLRRRPALHLPDCGGLDRAPDARREALDWINARSGGEQAVIVIRGVSGTGKSTLARYLAACIPDAEHQVPDEVMSRMRRNFASWDDQFYYRPEGGDER